MKNAVLSRLLLVALLSRLLVDAAWGATRNFKAGTTGDWSVAANWVEGSVPDHGDDVYITYTGSLAIISGASSNLKKAGTPTVSSQPPMCPATASTVRSPAGHWPSACP
ncbi:MAG: hypothetical protein HYV35_02145 [Lentisphaerae bacterium]|nr:hypothetical protein [Lentisphaerota bacterium]